MKVKDILIGMEENDPAAFAAAARFRPVRAQRRCFTFYDTSHRIMYGYDTDEQNIDKAISNFYYNLTIYYADKYTGKWKKPPRYDNFKPHVKQIPSEDFDGMRKKLGSAFAHVKD